MWISLNINNLKRGKIMVGKRIRKINQAPLFVEPHPEDYEGYPFITLIQYREKHFLTVIDNATETEIGAFVLDLCSPEGLNEEIIITIIAQWYEDSRDRYPLSIEFSKRGIAQELSKIYQIYNTDYVTRVIGPLPKFNMTETKTIRKRKRKTIPRGVELHNVVNFSKFG